MKKLTLLSCGLAVLLLSCTKSSHHVTEIIPSFQKFTIAKGNHYADRNSLSTVETAEMKFMVKFDSSAIYKTLDPVNQYDINKLYGFSDNSANHHQYSARFGWRWNDDSLRLFAYLYNAGQVSSKEIGSFELNREIFCSIRVEGKDYVFMADDKIRTMPRTATTPLGSGYQLYPYFGGDETAPHDIFIWIRNIN